ncbi:hypothetical protein [Mesorhizobium sp. M0898]|uniref:hypothetical protein n=1 Tax=Mesorhizobium sp. M0898 TaxID=2957020 RepID=UPI00333A4BE3
MGSGAYLVNVPRDGAAKLFTASGTQLVGASETVFESAEGAFAAAVAARDSGAYQLVRVWVEGPGMVDFPQIDEIYQYWIENPV